MLKIKTSRIVFKEISQKFGSFPFTLRALEDEKKARMGIVECTNHSLVTPYDVYQEKEGRFYFILFYFFLIYILSTPNNFNNHHVGDFIAQFFNTVLLTKNGIVKITNTLHDMEIVQSEKKIEDQEILDLLSTSIKSKKKNKKKKADEKDPVKEKENEKEADVAENTSQ